MPYPVKAAVLLSIIFVLFQLQAPSAVGRQRASLATVTYSLEELDGKVEILVDPWGIPHIYAGNFRNLFFAQGFNAARDRLWQIDLWRRKGLGQLSEIFGSRFVEKDRAARLLLYRGDMDMEWNAYAPDAREIASAFINGVNAYVRLTRHKAALLPIEFKLFGYEPAFWSPEDVVRIRTHGLWRNLRTEVQRSQLMCKFGPALVATRSHLEPPWEITVPQGTEPCEISSDVLKLYDLATSDVPLTADLLSSQSANSSQDQIADNETAAEIAGSNNWALSARLTATGRPIVANDPHRVLSVPSLRYAVHLAAPGINVIGAGEPFLPGISIGHNGTIGFGITIFPIDQEDLYFYQTNPQDPMQYRYAGRWERMKLLDEHIQVRGQEPVTVQLRFTRHGPVLYEDANRRIAYAARLAWLEPGMAPYFGSITTMRARDTKQLLETLRHWGGPSLNHVSADTHGNIAWKPWGRTPVRKNWDGLMPVSGDGRYEWTGFYEPEHLPQELNPPRGWVASANQMNLPEGFPYQERKIGFEWTAPWRYLRITEVLGTSSKATVADSLRLQTDYVCVPARRLTAMLRELDLAGANPKVRRALDKLTSWNCVMSADSVEAAIFEFWTARHLTPALLKKISGQAIVAEIPADFVLILNVLETDKAFGPDPKAARREILLSSLEAAVDELEQILGPDMERWRWGQLHHVFLQHPLAGIADKSHPSIFPRGYRVPRGGSHDTVGNTQYRAGDFRQTNGASWRMVLDVGNWDNSLAMNTPGQSGDPLSPHFSDLYLRWANDEAFALLYTRAKIEAVAEQRIVLAPGRK